MKKKGRGLSYEEKREKILKIFHTTKSVFNYHEIEKLSVKAGVPFPTVKDLLKGLEADNLIQNQKIGAGVFYWSFPSQAFQTYKTRIQITQKENAQIQQDNARLIQKIEFDQVGRQDTNQRLQKVETVKKLSEEKSQLQTQISKFIRFDPERVDLLNKENAEKKQKINFWTDNLEQFKKYVKNCSPGISNADIQAQYGISVDLDYVQ